MFNKAVQNYKIIPGLVVFLVFLGPISKVNQAYTMSKSASGLGNTKSFLAIFLTVIVLDLIATSIYHYLYYKLYYYNFTDEGAEIRKGVVSRQTGHVQYDRIQNIYIDQDFLDRIFGLYDIHYETAGEKSAFYSHVDGLNKENAEKLVAFLSKRVELPPNHFHLSSGRW